ncbi:hypothetical protein BN1058_00282 [Paraliobacillus sp. PM-2]|uniref:DUF6241 domain-containing protein n=1 Tax=Paraliobacillus sp. PM-2 TaxID=1462524 RepID=UPI00061C041E|nr:DUF6241 domain-containing protein [Paraliobacillus sp. PM-2]CQR46038.1 hypothetical protein BN1058_00282 [Paraliobacillus sp. PM-2]
MKVYHWIVMTLVVVLIGVLSFFGVQIYQDFYSNSNMPDSEVDQQQKETEGKQVTELSEEKFKNNQDKDLNPFGDTTSQTGLTNSDYQEYIHQMSHQKVKADEKWGFYLITEERINWLLEGLEQVELGENEAAYQSILKRWSNDDFSQADEDHNTVWRMQGGTIGKATDILSESEEEAFINSKQ